ncbi:BLUF domain-containing protein [Mucilaginibacter sp. CAU 1740]|uniref:BLUF domain-containing protein n=1 Tax=Mucilaginibacter sp. CAU 1740 TaxID=3140365 RepID=UPI00325B3FAA
MEYLVYVSTAKKTMEDADLLELLTQSRERNLQHNITGILLYSEGTFMQVLEGEKDDVYKIYASIERDLRHRNIIKLVTGLADKRVFPNWSMAFSSVNAETLEMIEGYFNSAKNSFELDKKHATVIMLKTFIDANKLSISF